MKSTTGLAPYAVGTDQGSAHWFVGALMIRKAGAEETGGLFDLLDQTVPGGYAPPRHVHHHDDEAWYILEGDVTFWCAERELGATRGGFVFLPKGMEHTFKVGAAGARLLTLAIPSGFAAFVREAGEVARERVVPAGMHVDPARLAEIAARFGIEITGPPPA